MKKKFITLCVILLNVGSITGQTVNSFCAGIASASTIPWTHDLKSTFDNGYVLITNGGLLLKFDQWANLQWSYFLSLPTFNGISETSDHHLIIVGEINDHILILKITSDGNLVWSKQIKFLESSEGFDLCETYDKNYVLVARTYSNPNYCTIIKLNQNGDLIWNRNYVLSTFDSNIIETTNHNLLIKISSYDLMCLDEYGSFLWAKSTLLSYSLGNLITATDGSLFVVGEHCIDCDGFSYYFRGVVYKLNDYGEIQWTYEYDGLGGRSFYHITATADGGLGIAGATGNVTSYPDGLIAKLQPNGDIEWAVSINNYWVGLIDRTSDSALIAAGEYSFAAKINLDGSGCTECFEPNTIARSTTTGLIESDVPEVIAGAILSDTTLIEKNYEQTMYYSCGQVGVESVKANILINVYPNPVCDFINIDVLPEMKGASIYLVDMNGKQITAIKFDDLSNKLDVSQISNGFYLLQIKSEEQVVSELICIQH